MNQNQQSSGQDNTHFGFSRSDVGDQARGLDSYVLIGMKSGKPQIWTSERDSRATQDLVKRAAPQIVPELTT